MAADGRPFVAVSDTGIGIAAEHRAHLFEPFYRVDKVRSRSHGGAGLGLALARNIAQAHGAIIELQSEPGLGSRFSVIFPSPTRSRLRQVLEKETHLQETLRLL